MAENAFYVNIFLSVRPTSRPHIYLRKVYKGLHFGKCVVVHGFCKNWLTLSGVHFFIPCQEVRKIEKKLHKTAKNDFPLDFKIQLLQNKE